MPLGLPICSTWSTAGKSTPRSRLDVATTHRTDPSRSPCSAARRSAGSSEPWCRASVAGSSIHTEDSARCHSSACARVLANSSVLRALRRRAMTRCTCDRPRCPAHGKRSPSSGSSVSSTSERGRAACTIAASGRCGNSTSRACSRLPSVADTPQVRSAGAHARTRARHSCSSTPRLLPISSCHSSTTTVRTPASCACVSG